MCALQFLAQARELKVRQCLTVLMRCAMERPRRPFLMGFFNATVRPGMQTVINAQCCCWANQDAPGGAEKAEPSQQSRPNAKQCPPLHPRLERLSSDLPSSVVEVTAF